MTKRDMKISYHHKNKVKSRFKTKSALVLTLFLANVVYTSGAIPVISDGIVAYADVYYSYSPDDDCGVVGDRRANHGSGDKKDSSNSNSVSSSSLEDTVWTKKRNKGLSKRPRDY